MVEYSKHHLVPVSRDGSDEPHNKVVLKDSKHRAIHILMGNRTPVEQLRELVKLNEPCLTDEFTKDLYLTLCCDDPSYFYQKGVLIKRTNLKTK